jgi:glucose/arabinose dehydrogenase
MQGADLAPDGSLFVLEHGPAGGDVLDDGSIVFLTDFENGSVMHVTAKD